MKLVVKLETKTLTIINTKMFDDACIKVNTRLLKARHRIQFYLSGQSQRYYINTYFHTSNTRMCGCNYHDTEFNVVENAQLTMSLKELFANCNSFIDEHYDWDIAKIKDGIRAIIDGDSIEQAQKTAEDVSKHELIKYIDKEIIPSKREGTATVYEDTKKYLYRYMEYKQVEHYYIEDIDTAWLKDFYAFMFSLRKKNGQPLSDSTIQMHFRTLRHVLNTAYEYELIPRLPFGRTMAKFNMPRVTLKRHLVLSMQEFADFRDYPVPENIQRFKDLALLVFYLNGINLADILTVKTINKGRIEFARQKTGVDSSFIVHPEAEEIINKYRGKGQLLNFLDTIRSVGDVTSKANKRLKQVGYSYISKDKVGKMRKVNYCPMFPDISIYTMRRSLSSLLAEIDCPTEIINMALSHANPSPYLTTEIYIRRNNKKIDTWTRKLFDELASIKGRPKEVIDEELKLRCHVN